jgi:nucleotide-binding universal stress UspA family protein
MLDSAYRAALAGWAGATGVVRALAEKVEVEFEELIILGRPDRAIVVAAEEIGADPIVLGSESKSRMEHTLLGSVSEEVLRHANRTVLMVGGHPEGESPEKENQRKENL